MELKSLSQRIECVKLESWSLRMFLVSLGYSSMRLGVPFIAPRQLRDVGGQQGRPSLPSIEWRTGQSGTPPDSHCRRSSADLLPFLAQTTIAASGQLAHRTVRCPLSTVGAGDCTTDRCAGDRWFTGHSGAPPDSPVNYSRTPLNFSRERLVHRKPACAPPDSPVCQAELDFGCTQPSLLQFFLFLFLALRQNMLVLKTMY
jgi:hypothetical protein